MRNISRRLVLNENKIFNLFNSSDRVLETKYFSTKDFLSYFFIFGEENLAI
jgi:hypothetical protein